MSALGLQLLLPHFENRDIVSEKEYTFDFKQLDRSGTFPAFFKQGHT